MSVVHLLAAVLWPPKPWLTRHRERLPRLPSLERCLTAGRHALRPEPDGYDSCLFQLFGMPAGAGGELPVAAATHWADFDGDHEGYWLRADPVHLRPDLGKLLLFDAQRFELAHEEAAALVGELNQHLKAENLEILLGRDARRWYLRVPQPQALSTTPPYCVVGQHIDGYLPEGRDARYWLRLCNELQMVLHQSAVNAARERRGEVAVNSVWFWGAGSLPVLRKRLWERVVTDDPLATGLAHSQGSDVESVTDRPCPEIAVSSSLWVLASGMLAGDGGDFEAWTAAVLALDRRYVAPLLEALSAGTCRQVALHLPERTCTLTSDALRRYRWQFWRRRRPAFTW